MADWESKDWIWTAIVRGVLLAIFMVAAAALSIWGELV